MLYSAPGGRCSLHSSPQGRGRGGPTPHPRRAYVAAACPALLIKQRPTCCAAHGTKGSSASPSQPSRPDSSAQPPKQPGEEHQGPPQQGQQLQTEQGKGRQLQQPSSISASSSASKGNSYPYDNTRWWVRSKDWKKGAPPQEQRPMDFLVVSPRNSPHRHATYMTAQLLDNNRGRIMLLFYGAKGAAKVLSMLHIATQLLQRKYDCTLLCQVGPSDQDAFKMKLIARMWPYAGTWSPVPAPTSSSNGPNIPTSTSAAIGVHPAVASAAGTPTSSSTSTTTTASTASSSSSSASGSGSSTSKKPPRGPNWLRKGLSRSLPDPQQLRPCVRHLPPFALPLVISKQCSYRAGRATDPKILAHSIAAAIARKGRCRVETAGGIAALRALQAVRLADVVLARGSQQGLVMHVQHYAVDAETGLPAEGGDVAEDGDGTAAAAALPSEAGGELQPAQTGAATAADSAAAGESAVGDGSAAAEGEEEEEEEEEAASAAAAVAAADIGGYVDLSEEAQPAGSGSTAGGEQGLWATTQQQFGGQQQRPQKQRKLLLYTLTLIAANRDWDATPCTSVFPVRRSKGLTQQQQQQEGTGV